MVDIRHHVASLIAVFFALALGILIGISIAEREILTDEKTSLISHLESYLDSLREENFHLEQKVLLKEDLLESYEVAIEQSRKKFLSNILDNRVVSILATSSYDETAYQLASFLKQHGANISTFITKDEWSSDILSNNMAKLLDKDLDMVIREMTEVLTTGELNTTVINLIAEGFLLPNQIAQKTADTIIFINVDLPFLKELALALQEIDLLCVAIEHDYLKTEFSVPYENIGWLISGQVKSELSHLKVLMMLYDVELVEQT